MIEFLKRAYEELYDLPAYYIGIEEGWRCHVFSILFLIMIAAVIVWFVKMSIGFRKSSKQGKRTLKNIQKSLLDPYDQKLNEKNKNIR